MNVKDLTDVVNASRERQDKLFKTKGDDYTRHDPDRLANFKRLAKDLDLDPLKVWAVYAGKHWDAIMAYIKTGKAESEPINGRIDDSHNYLYLLEGLIAERDIHEPPYDPSSDFAMSDAPINGIVELHGVCPDTGLSVTQVLSPDLPDFIQSEYYPSKPEWLPHIYQRLMMCIFTKRSESKNLFLGLCAGAMLKALAIQDPKSDNIAVDNDRKMIEYFTSKILTPVQSESWLKVSVIEADAMDYLFKDVESFDHIFVDLYSSVINEALPFMHCVVKFVDALSVKTKQGVAINIPNVNDIHIKSFEGRLKQFFPSVFVLSLEYVDSAIRGAIVLAHKDPNYYPNLIEHVEHFNATEAEVLSHMEQRVDYRIGEWQPK